MIYNGIYWELLDLLEVDTEERLRIYSAVSETGQTGIAHVVFGEIDKIEQNED